MVIQSFTFAKIPKVYFGAGRFNELGKLIAAYGNNALIVTGGVSFKASGKWDSLFNSLKKQSIRYDTFAIQGEPSPELVDGAAEAFKDRHICVVVAIGGGSVVDGGKAISAMLPLQGDSVVHYLEGVGTKTHDGRKIPFIAVPTTAGTGSEATKNAVLSRVGEKGFKKSLRHDSFVPEIALIDPELSLSCPPNVTAACGMDAFCQLLESFVSTNASPMTDALALSGIAFLKDALAPSVQEGAGDVSVRGAMAYASFLSGVTLANAGLGVVHGLASPIGGYFDIPHGVVCGTLVGAAVKSTINALIALGAQGEMGLKKYAQIGALLVDERLDVLESCQALVETIEKWINILALPRLSQYGVNKSHLSKIIDSGDNKQNPIKLTREQMRDLLLERL
jgi:alcohol dehydrogenase class IV